MRLGGVILGCVGIIVVVLVANGRWDNVWAAATGTTGAGASAAQPAGTISGANALAGALGGATYGDAGGNTYTLSGQSPDTSAGSFGSY